MQALVTALVLASALLGASGALAVSGPGHLTSIVEVIETTLGLNPTHRASGVLLSSRYVLSTKKAAKKAGLGKQRHVVVGRSTGQDGKAVEIEERVESPDGLLLLLKLKDEVDFDAVTKPANLPHRNTDNSGASALLAGWGEKHDTLKSSTVNVLSKEECAKKGVKEDLLCSADPGTGACGGDEGSPLVQDLKNGVYKLVGLVADAQDVKTCLKTNAYYDVAKYTEWILSTVYA